jgi:hypothetical protein
MYLLILVSYRVADRGDGLQVWRVAGNILNKPSQTADMWWSPDWGLGERLSSPWIYKKEIRVGKAKEKRPLRRPRRRWEDSSG